MVKKQFWKLYAQNYNLLEYANHKLLEYANQNHAITSIKVKKGQER